ncbi:hypothetical protein KIPB_013331, partial [Kipferlia bialata]|eukprot:g13331.t1
MHFYVK